MSDQYAQCNGDRIVSGSIAMPYYGTWAGDIVLASVDALPSTGDAISISIGALSLKGTAFRSGAFAGSRSVRVVGGAAGWRKTLPARAYSLSSGVRLSMIMRDAAADLGEQIELASDRIVGSAYVRAEGPGTRLLRDLCGPEWWMRGDGVTRVADTRPSSKIATQFDVIAWKGDLGWFEIATEQHQDWMPGNTFSSPTVPATQMISLVTFVMTGEGKLRVEVLSAGESNA